MCLHLSSSVITWYVSHKSEYCWRKCSTSHASPVNLIGASLERALGIIEGTRLINGLKQGDPGMDDNADPNEGPVVVSGEDIVENCVILGVCPKAISCCVVMNVLKTCWVERLKLPRGGLQLNYVTLSFICLKLSDQMLSVPWSRLLGLDQTIHLSFVEFTGCSTNLEIDCKETYECFKLTVSIYLSFEL